MKTTENVVAPNGSRLYAAVIGAENLDRSIAFYRDCIGFDVADRSVVDDTAFCRLMDLPDGSRTDVVNLADREAEVGRIFLLSTEGLPKRLVRDFSGQEFFGLINLNFYCIDVDAAVQKLEEAGYHAWSKATVHDMGPDVGAPKEVMIDGPDGVIINLIELATTDTRKRVGQMREYVAREFGYNRQGFTPVVTTQHSVKDLEKARAFFTEVLKCGVLIDTVMDSDEMRTFMAYPPGARARSVFMQGDHMFGKVALNDPLNFPCTDRTGVAVPPNIGYLMQAFFVPDLSKALKACSDLSAPVFSGPEEVTIPGIGPVLSAIVRNPGSGSLQQLIQR